MTRTVAAALVLLTLSGCGSKSDPYRPPADPPDLWAVEGYFHWGSISIGPQPSRMTGTRTSVASNDNSTVVVGTGAQPALRMVSTGISQNYRVQFFIDDVLWWDADAHDEQIPNGWSGLIGTYWSPPDTGVHVIRMVIDPDNQVAEVDETNNEARFEAHVVPGDLVAGMIQFVQWREGQPHQVDEVSVGTPISVIAWSHAHGAYPGHRGVLSACGSVLMDHRVTLRGGTIWPDMRMDTLSFTATTIGQCEFRYEVDPDGEFPLDANRADNTNTRTLTVHY